MLRLSAVALSPDPARVVTELFVPGGRLPAEKESRAAGLVARIMDLEEDDVEAACAWIMERFSGRYRTLETVFKDNYEVVGQRLGRQPGLTLRRKLLIGAYFTLERAIESAALTNPSMVEHPDQSGVAPGSLRFLMSVRAIGENHVSCIEFRTGVIDPDGELSVDRPAPFPAIGHATPHEHDRSSFFREFGASETAEETFGLLQRHLPERFTVQDVEEALGRLPAQPRSRRQTDDTVEHVYRAAACRYEVAFSPETDLSERVLWPQNRTEQHGMEDARFVRVAGVDGGIRYSATYTAFDGVTASARFIETDDFLTFRMSQLIGPAAADKGLALFPRVIDGTHFALSRWDMENTHIAASPDGRRWDDVRQLQPLARTWELVQGGNCGSPVEIPEGWLVLTHGVGPMRSYTIGAMLLDRDDPCRVLAVLDRPLLMPDVAGNGGNVPNIVYSCGAIRHGGNLIIPFGVNDTGIRFASASIAELVARMRPPRGGLR
ncbi:MAG: hypothetical protein AUG49_22445 [Catenulispora sp. 13_1_20CM_3_70_7]|nr:MAG: hypothetical protein AUG49_22445 [Catenulispora sp. 13_1_20CM_3_70_7]